MRASPLACTAALSGAGERLDVFYSGEQPDRFEVFPAMFVCTSGKARNLIRLFIRFRVSFLKRADSAGHVMGEAFTNPTPVCFSLLRDDLIPGGSVRH